MTFEKVNFISNPRTGTNSIRALIPYENDTFSNHKSIRLTKDNRFSFAVIRNPLRRLMSWYKYHNFPQYDPYGTIYGGVFKDWVLRGCPHHWTDDMCIGRGVSSPLIQAEFVCNEAWTEIMVDQLVDYDHLDSEFKTIALKYGITRDLPTLNTSPIDAIGVSVGIQQIIMDLFQKDYDIYNNLKNK